MNNIELLIKGAQDKIYLPIVEDGITWETTRTGAPSKLTFTVIKDNNIAFSEGAKVQLKVNGTGIFIGFIFEKSRDKEHRIQCVAYDQLRYFKNKDTYIYTNKTASEVLQMVASDFNLTTGTVEDTAFRIAKRDEDNQTLFDIVLNALDITTANTKKKYILYDDFGKITLKGLENMKIDLLVDQDTAENFDYKTSIDSDTYNQIKIVKENDKTGKRDVYMAVDNNNIGRWGTLQYYEVLSDDSNPQNVVETLLKLKNRKTKELSVKGAFGDFRVRAGSLIPVILNLGDDDQNTYLLCDSVTHHISADHHSMDISFVDSGIGNS